MVYGLSDPKVCARYHCAAALGSRRRAPLTCRTVAASLIRRHAARLMVLTMFSPRPSLRRGPQKCALHVAAAGLCAPGSPSLRVAAPGRLLRTALLVGSVGLRASALCEELAAAVRWRLWLSVSRPRGLVVALGSGAIVFGVAGAGSLPDSG